MSTLKDPSWIIERWENKSLVEDDGKEPMLPSQSFNLVLPRVSDDLEGQSPQLES